MFEKHIYRRSLLERKRLIHQYLSREERERVFQKLQLPLLNSLDFLLNKHPVDQHLTLPPQLIQPKNAVGLSIKRLLYSGAFPLQPTYYEVDADKVPRRQSIRQLHPPESRIVIAQLEREIHKVVTFAHEQNRAIIDETPFLQHVLDLYNYFAETLFRATGVMELYQPRVIDLAEQFQALMNTAISFGVQRSETGEAGFVDEIMLRFNRQHSREAVLFLQPRTVNEYVEAKVIEFQKEIEKLHKDEDQLSRMGSEREAEALKQQGRETTLVRLQFMSAQMSQLMDSLYEDTMLPTFAELQQYLFSVLESGIHTALETLVGPSSLAVQVHVEQNGKSELVVRTIFFDQDSNEVPFFIKQTERVAEQIMTVDQLIPALQSPLQKIQEKKTVTPAELIEAKKIEYLVTALENIKTAVRNTYWSKGVPDEAIDRRMHVSQFGRNLALMLIASTQEILKSTMFRPFLALEGDKKIDKFFWHKLSHSPGWFVELIQWALMYHGLEHYRGVFSDSK